MQWDGSAQAIDQLCQTQTWRSLFQQFIDFAAPEASDLVLELGSRSGRLTIALAQQAQEVQGIEPDPNLFALAERNIKSARLENVTLERGPLDDLPYADGTFDLCCAFLVLHLSQDPTAVVKEMTRVTRAGGRLACLNPAPEMNRETVEQFLKKSMPSHLLTGAMYALAEEAEQHHRFSEDDLSEIFGAAGIYEVEVESALGGLYLLARGRRS